MGEMIYWELDYMLSCILWGLILMLIYDSLRIERIVFQRGSIWISIEDILYWSFAAIGTFRLFYKQDNGVIRWFAIAATFLVMLLMNRFISRWTVPFIGRILRVPVAFVEKLLKGLFGFFGNLAKKFEKRLKWKRKKATIKKQEKKEKREKQKKEKEKQKEQKELEKRKERKKQEEQKELEKRKKQEEQKSKESKKNKENKRNKEDKRNRGEENDQIQTKTKKT